MFWNRRVNLTAIAGDREIVLYHFVDSLTALPFIADHSTVLDLGSGAGFPGIPLGIVNPTLRITLLDSSSKKVFFMREVIRRLELKGIEALWGRAGEPGLSLKQRAYEYVVTRAVGGIRKLFSISYPYLAQGGRLILMRGKRGDEELRALGGRYFEELEFITLERFKLPGSGRERTTIIVFERKRP